MMRIRQVVFAARDLERTVEDLCTVFGIEIAFRDPGVAEFGLVNAVMPVGDTFLEVISPVTPSAPAQRWLDRRRGDGGYMLILQSNDLDRDRARVAGLGIRTVWKMDLEDIRGTHLHPHDTGGTLLSLDEAKPPESWRWAGPEWKKHARRERVRQITAAEMQSRDPQTLAARWSEILDRPARELSSGGFEIALDQGQLRFVADRDGRGEGLVGFDVQAADRDALLGSARDRGVAVSGDHITIGGVRIAFG